MAQDPDFKAAYEEGMRPITQRLTDSVLDHMRTSAIGGASFSTAIVLLVLQTGIASGSLRISLYAAALAIPAWLTAWQYVETYIFYGRSSYNHFNSPKGSGVAVLLVVAGALLLLTSLGSLIWHLSPGASLLFLMTSLLAGGLIFRHNHAVKNEAEGMGQKGV